MKRVSYHSMFTKIEQVDCSATTWRCASAHTNVTSETAVRFDLTQILSPVKTKAMSFTADMLEYFQQLSVNSQLCVSLIRSIRKPVCN